MEGDNGHFFIMRTHIRQLVVWYKRMTMMFPVNPDIMRGEQCPLKKIQVYAVCFVSTHMFHINAHPENSPEARRFGNHEQNKKRRMTRNKRQCSEDEHE